MRARGVRGRAVCRAMSDMLPPPAHATKTIAQDARGTMFSRGVATLVSPFFDQAYPRRRLSRFNVIGKFRAVEDGMDADRDRGTPRDVAPPTPPGIRVRTTAVRPVEPSRWFEIRKAKRVEDRAR